MHLPKRGESQPGAKQRQQGHHILFKGRHGTGHDVQRTAGEEGGVVIENHVAQCAPVTRGEAARGAAQHLFRMAPARIKHAAERGAGGCA